MFIINSATPGAISTILYYYITILPTTRKRIVWARYPGIPRRGAGEGSPIKIIQDTGMPGAVSTRVNI